MTAPTTQAVHSLPELPEKSGHVHSDGSFCWDRQTTPYLSWPIDLFTDFQMRAYALSAISAHEAEVGRLREALHPLSLCHLPPKDCEHLGVTAHFTTEEIKRARAALSTSGETK